MILPGKIDSGLATDPSQQMEVKLGLGQSS